MPYGRVFEDVPPTSWVGRSGVGPPEPPNRRRCGNNASGKRRISRSGRVQEQRLLLHGFVAAAEAVTGRCPPGATRARAG